MLSDISRNRLDVEALNQALAVLLCMAIFYFECKVYDLASAMFVALGLALMARRAWGWYFLVFCLGSLNRETMVLLGLVFAIHYWKRLSLRLWAAILVGQLATFGILRAWLTFLFASTPGVTYWLRLEPNVLYFVQHPGYAVLHWLGFGFVIWLCLRKWRSRPALLRSAFVVLIPALTLIYLVFGWVGEIRVFVEAIPVLWGLMTYRADTITYPVDIVSKTDLRVHP